MSELMNLIMTIDADGEVSQEALEALGEVIGPARDIQAVDSIVAHAFGFDPPRFALIRLIKAWNSSKNAQITGLDAYIDTGRTRYLKEVDKMEQAVSKMDRLKDVFPPAWFHALRAEIKGWNGIESFTTESQGAFISYLQFSRENGLLAEINDAFSRLSGW